MGVVLSDACGVRLSEGFWRPSQTLALTFALQLNEYKCLRAHGWCGSPAQRAAAAALEGALGTCSGVEGRWGSARVFVVAAGFKNKSVVLAGREQQPARAPPRRQPRSGEVQGFCSAFTPECSMSRCIDVCPNVQEGGGTPRACMGRSGDAQREGSRASAPEGMSRSISLM